MQTVRSQNNISTNELLDMFCEFDLLLRDFLFSDAGYFSIDNTLNEILFDLRYFGRKKGAHTFITSSANHKKN